MVENDNNTLYYKRRLPHLYKENHPVFLTWRLKFTLPKHVTEHLREMKENHDKHIANLSEEYEKMQSYTFHKKVFGYLDSQLNEGKNMPDLLNQAPLAQIVKESLHFHNNKKYSLHSFCIMPNHVHAMITPYSNKQEYKKSLSTITQSWKGYTARMINLALDRTGSLWSEETYDHLVRSESEFARIVSYIINNPVKANLVDRWDKWEFNWVTDEFKNIIG